MNNDVINCIPSKTMREYLTVNPIEMSALQQATIVYNYAKKKNRLLLFRQLLEETDDDAEKLFLSSAIKDVQNGVEGYSDETKEIYEKEFPHDGFPAYPFLEVCGLPALFREGDVIRWHGKGNTLYYVGGLPLLILGHCDFTDECYLSYSLSYPVKNDHDLLLVHEHINLCEAERASIKKLTPQQKNIYHRVRTILSIMKMKKGFDHE
ncbi:MAG: hypothetical protein IJP69_01440 [Synergistaceae bacterium]|nr:hypothetical protein [Synergistaceae bacterium]